MAKAPAKAGSSATPVQSPPRVVPPRVPPIQVLLPTQATGASSSSPQPPAASSSLVGGHSASCGSQATGDPVVVRCVAAMLKVDSCDYAHVLNATPEWYGATPPFHDGINIFWWHPVAHLWFWGAARSGSSSVDWGHIPDDFHEALANAGPGEREAEAIATAVPGAHPSTFLGQLHVGAPKCVIFGDGKAATPPVLRHDADGSITLFWWHPLVLQWCWFDNVALEWVGVSEQWHVQP